MRNISIILLFNLICFLVQGQIIPDSIPEKKESIRLNIADIGLNRDTLTKQDTIRPGIGKKAVIAASQDVEDIVSYGSVDSTELDNTNQILHLWGEAYVHYQDAKIQAYYISVDLKNNIATAEVGLDDRGRPLGKPLVEIEGQNIVANRITFNFKSKKGIIHDGRTKQNDLYINGKLIKVIAGPSDSIQTDDVAYQKDALITTCNHPDAHFGIRASRMKVVPDRVAVIGPSYVEIGGVPTPLVLPFGFFPMKKGKRTGILFPNDYTFSPQFGYGFREIGYYFPINDKMDVTVDGDIYLRGSHRLSVSSNYKTLYKYSGNASLSYSTFYSEASDSYAINKNTSYSLIVSHVQDPKANPYHNFGGNINIQSGNFRSLNYNDANNYLTNNLASNLTYRRIFAGKPYNFSASMTHSQQLTSRKFSLSLPKVDFNTQSIFPFKNKNRIGDEKWYDQISFTYSAAFDNRFETYDTTLFTPQTLRASRQGLSQKVNVASAYKVFKYFNISPSFNYNEVWGFNSIDQYFDPTVVFRFDTVYINDDPDQGIESIVQVPISNGSIQKDTISEFGAFRTYNASLGINTQLFGMMQFKKGFVRGIRHQMRPTLSLAFAPDYTHYFESVQTSNDEPIQTRNYSKYDEYLMGRPTFQKMQLGLSLGISNSLEMKVMGRGDTVARKIKIFDNFSVNTFYNFIADSLKLSPLTYNATTRLFKGLSTLNLNGSFDFYDRNARLQKIDLYMWNSKRKIARFVFFSASINTNLTVEKIRKLLKGNLTESEAVDRSQRNNEPLSSQSFWDLLDNFSITHTASMRIDDNIGRNKINFNANSVNLNGVLQVTEKWAVNIGFFGYDFKNKDIVYPDIGFTRDLHCWQMHMSWQPVRGTYSFGINVKPGTLDFLRVPLNKNRQDVFTNF